MLFNQELSYKQICQELDQPEVKSGRNRDLQLARWNKQYEIEKVGRGKYVIKRQLTEEEMMDIQDRNNYSRYIQATLLNFIAENPDIQMVYTYRQLREHLYMVNSHYFPTKYKKEEINIKAPFGFDEFYCEDFQDKWFDIADAHDKYVINYALNKLKDNGLISGLEETYMFYKKIWHGDKVIIITDMATLEQKVTIDQIKLDFIKEKGQKTFRDIFLMGQKVLREYYNRINDYVHSLGFDRYAKAFIIVRPLELARVADYFAPKFNALQVTRYLDSKRFKTIPPFIHQQLTDKLIKV